MLNIFNSTIDYQGQDLHMLRNGEAFPFHNFFDNSINDLSYTFRLQGTEITDANTSYEKISISVIKTSTKVDVVNINANKYENTTDYQINNFYITVESASLNQKAVILVHLHDTIEKVWSSPEIPSFRSGMSLKLGVMAYFNDNIYADLSFYYNMDYQLAAGANNIFTQSGNRLLRHPIGASYPPEASLPKPISNVMNITLPRYLRNTSTAVVLNCSVNIMSDLGTLNLHSGDITKIDERTNILFLSDGFDGTNAENADMSAFHNFINEFDSNVLKTTSYTPWNYLKENMNIWSYYTQDPDRVGSVEGDYVLLDAITAANIYHVIIQFDSVLTQISNSNSQFLVYPVLTYINNLTPYIGLEMINFIDLQSAAGSEPNLPIIRATDPNSSTPTVPVALTFMDLRTLCSMVGFPTQIDLGIQFSDMVTKWIALGWIPNNLKIQGDSLNTSDIFLHEHVFEIWKKLHNRIMFEKADTTYGMTYTDLYRKNREDLIPYNVTLPGINKFIPVEYSSAFFNDFGKFINKIKGSTPETQNFGSKFYTTDGDPVLKGVTEFDKIVKQCDNIVILSRVKTANLYGANISYPYSNYLVHRSIVSLEEKFVVHFKCVSSVATAQKPVTYKVSSIDVNTGTAVNNKTNIELRNTIAHEFSHNYLRDEYSGSLGTASNLDNALQGEQIAVTINLKASNLQTGYQLKPANQNQVTIDGNLIKWRWPRVKKICIGKLDVIQDNITDLGNNTYSCKLETNAIDKKDVDNFFEKNDKILLRKRFLFETDYIECTIEAILNQDTNFQEVVFKPVTPLDIFQRRSYDDGFMLILPFWDINDPNKYQELVHHEIREAISTTSSAVSGVGRPLVALDNLDYNIPQVIDSAFLSQGNNNNIIKKFTNPSLIVGLYAGGIDKYSAGLYHASGFCLMRGANSGSANRFCPVCSYIMIDYINPIKHALADPSYGVYPV